MPEKSKSHINEKDQERARESHPRKPDREPEAPGGRKHGKGEQDAADKTTRRGER